MRRGFLSGPRRVAAGASNPAPPPASLSAATKSAQAASTAQAQPEATERLQSVFDVPSNDDYTAIYEEDPVLILQSDHRYDTSPYFGYFPPNAKESSMVLVADLETIESAVEWDCWDAWELPDIPEDQRCFHVRATENKGFGMFATRDIKAGTLVWKERPIYVSMKEHNLAPDQGVKTGLFHRNAASQLGRQQKIALLALSSCYPAELMHELPGKLQTNNLAISVGSERDASQSYCGAFPILSRANHACNPNMNYCFNFPDFTGRFFAAKDVKAGEELTITYTDPLSSRKERQEVLLHGYRFTCLCSICNARTETVKQSDANRAMLKQIHVQLQATPPPVMSLSQLEGVMALLDREELRTYRPSFLLNCAASLFEQHTKDGAIEGTRWLKEARQAYTMLEGDDSLTALSLQPLA